MLKAVLKIVLIPVGQSLRGRLACKPRQGLSRGYVYRINEMCCAGFDTSQILAKKLVLVFKLCTEQLSQQAHYDFGMRALKPVLTAAEHLRQAHPLQLEESILVQAIGQANLPKVVGMDADLLWDLLLDVFPSVTHAEQVSKQLLA